LLFVEAEAGTSDWLIEPRGIFGQVRDNLADLKLE
jgi:hypothetical protein